MTHIKSHAKINLFFNIVGKRADGYHLLESFFTPISLADDVYITPAQELTCEVKGKKVVNNIVLKVGNALREKYSIKEGAHIAIDKKIPIGAGLGGGSSNAACAIKALCKLWNIQMSQQEMVDFSVKYGADIPFFIYETPAFVQGIGEDVMPMKLGIKLHLLLVNPGVEVLTKTIFTMGFPKFTAKITELKSIKDLVIHGVNDMECNAIAACPVIGNLIQEIIVQKGCIAARMSGSGSTCFGIFDDEARLQVAYQALFGSDGRIVMTDIIVI